MLHFGLGAVNGRHTHHHEGWQHGLQVGTGREHVVGRPDHQPLVIGLGQVECLHQALDHAGAERVHLGLDAGNQHLLVQRPQPDGLVLMQRGAGGLGLERLRAQHAFGEMLARVHRQLAHRHKLAGARVPGASRCVHTAGLGHRALEHPVWQGRVAQGAAGINVLFHHLRHVQPAGLLPQLERALLHAKAPAQAQVHIARVVGNGGQVHGGVMKAVAQNGPQKPTLRALAVAQQAQALGSRLFEHAGVDLVGLLPGGHVLA